MKFFRSKIIIKKRKYAIKRDDEGNSARKRAFTAFSQGKNFDEVCAIAGISKRTAYRYKASWKTISPNLERDYALLNKARKAAGGLSDAIISKLAQEFGMTFGEIKSELGKPWGLKRMLMGKWPNGPDQRKAKEIEESFDLAIDLGNILKLSGLSLEEMIQAVARLKQSKVVRDELDRKIKLLVHAYFEDGRNHSAFNSPRRPRSDDVRHSL